MGRFEFRPRHRQYTPRISRVADWFKWQLCFATAPQEATKKSGLECWRNTIVAANKRPISPRTDIVHRRRRSWTFDRGGIAPPVLEDRVEVNRFLPPHVHQIGRF